LTGLAIGQTSQQTPPPAQNNQPAAPAQTAPNQGGTPSGSAAGQNAQPGLRTVNPSTLVMTFYTVQPADMTASNLLDTDVYNLQNEQVGEIEDLVIDDGKRIRALVVGVGGFLGLGERYVAVDPASILINREANGSMRAVVNTTRDDLSKAPEFKFEGNMRRNR